MGRGRAKAKQTRVARELKYHSPNTDLAALQPVFRPGNQRNIQLARKLNRRNILHCAVSSGFHLLVETLKAGPLWAQWIVGVIQISVTKSGSERLPNHASGC